MGSLNLTSMGTLFRVPICTKCIEAHEVWPLILTKNDKKDPAVNFGLNCDYFGQNCDMYLAHTRTRAHVKRSRLIMCTPSGCTYAPPFGWCIGAGNEPKASGRATMKEKNKSRPIMGAPEGHPYAHPEGVCINGLGALPSPYGPPLRGAHNGPSGLQKKKKKNKYTR